MLSVRNLRKSFGAGEATRDVSLEVARGQVHALIGPNGAGKTTLISLIAGELKPDSGTLWLEGQSITKLGIPQRARLGLGRSFQISQLMRDFTVVQNVMIALLAADGRERRFWRPALADPGLRARAIDLLGSVDLHNEADAPLTTISHGGKRQLELALVMASRAKLLLLDEPMAGLGHQETARMTRTIAALKSQVAILLVEHDMEAVFTLADTLSVLVRGAIVSTGTGETIRNDPVVRQAYLGNMV